MARKKSSPSRRRVLVVTGTRAEFGLLTPVMRAIERHPKLALDVLATGAHLLPPARTVREVKAAFPCAFTAPMQRPGKTGRLEDAAATARGVEGVTRAIARVKPDWVVVLGDRIEAFAAASAASIAGVAVCHIHGGDRAEGIADEAMRHAITKLSHLHCAATEQSRTRIVKMGERPEHVFNTGSPAIDGLDKIKPMSDAEAKTLGDPRVVMLLHPSGNLNGMPMRFNPTALRSAPEPEFQAAPLLPRTAQFNVEDPESVFAFFTYTATACLPDEPPLGPCRNGGLTPCGGVGPRGIFLHPNHDPGSERILDRWQRVTRFNGWPILAHLPRTRFIALLKRMAAKKRGLLVGNSSAGLIECAALGVPALNVGPRQAGREHDRNVVHANPLDTIGVAKLIRRADKLAGTLPPSNRFGQGDAGEKIATLLARIDPRDPALLRKRNTY